MPSTNLFRLSLLSFFSFAASAPATPPVAKVLGVKSDKELVTISQNRAKPWKLGEEACVARGGSELACGEVIFVGQQTVTIKLMSKKQIKTTPPQRHAPKPKKTSPTPHRPPVEAKTNVTPPAVAAKPLSVLPIAEGLAEKSPPPPPPKPAIPQKTTEREKPSRETASTASQPRQTTAGVTEAEAAATTQRKFRVLLLPSVSLFQVHAADLDNASSAVFVSPLSLGITSQFTATLPNVGEAIVELRAQNYSLTPPEDKVFLTESSLLISGSAKVQWTAMKQLKVGAAAGLESQPIVVGRDTTSLSIEKLPVPFLGFSAEIPLVSFSLLALGLEGELKAHFSSSGEGFIFRKGLSFLAGLNARYTTGAWITQGSIGYGRFNADTSIVSQGQNEFVLRIGGGRAF